MEAETKGTTVKCLVCEKTAEPQKMFMCRSCRKSPFCFEHLDGEYRICSGCAAEKRITLYHDLLVQERSVRGFLRFTQFIVVLAVFFFSFDRFFHEYIPDFVKGSVFFEYVFYWGGAAVAAMGLCYVIIVSQKQRMRDVDDKIQSHRAHSRYLFR